MKYSDNEINNTVEMILRKYYTYRAMAQMDIEELSELLAKCTASYDPQPHGTDMGNQTLDLVERRNEPTINMKRARAIEIIFESLKQELKEFCKQYFFEQNRRAQVEVEMHIEKNKFYTLKGEVIAVYRELLPWKQFGERKEEMQPKTRKNEDETRNKIA